MRTNEEGAELPGMVTRGGNEFIRAPGGGGGKGENGNGEWGSSSNFS